MSKPTLVARIEQIRAEANAFIDEKAAELKKENPTLPLGVLRGLLTAKAAGCECRQALALIDGVKA